MNWTKKLLEVIIFIFFFLLALKVVDLTLGLVDSKPKKIERSIVLREATPNLDKYFVPENDFMADTENLEQKPYRLRTDKNGFIIGNRDLSDEKSGQKVDIIFFGGSTTECKYVDEENRFPYLVSEKLKNNNGQLLKVLNGGVSGNHSMHSFFSFVAKGIPQEPTFVVLMHAVNDLSVLSKTLSYWNSPDNSRKLIIGDVKAVPKSDFPDTPNVWKTYIFPNIWNRVKNIIASKLHAKSNDEWSAYRDKKIPAKEVEKVLNYQFRASLKSFIRVSRLWNIEPILMTQFNRIKEDDKFVESAYDKKPQPISYKDYVRLYELSNNIVRDVAREENVLLIDLDKEIPASKKYIYDAVHLNTNGSKLVSEVISNALLKKYPDYFNTLSSNQ